MTEDRIGKHMGRFERRPENSYSASLFDAGVIKILKKINEEATEVIMAAKGEGRERVIAQLNPSTECKVKLAIVDIDGTLTDTKAVDADCYVRAVSRVLGRSFSEDWVSYRNVTDSGILEELCREAIGRSPTASEAEAIEDAMMEELAVALRREPEAFRAISGAREFIEECVRTGWSVALATGSWKRSALFKLEAAGLPTDLALANGNDDQERVAIVRHAIHSVNPRGETGRIVLIGDALWDVKAAKGLRFPFVGIATGETAQQLRADGATHVMADFRDLPAVFEALHAARIPGD